MNVQEKWIIEQITRKCIARIISAQIIEEKVSFFHDQKSTEFFEDMQTRRYSITEQ